MNVAIVSHVYATGPAQELESYLKLKVNTLFFLGHPFQSAKDVRTFMKKYERGRIVFTRIAYPFRLPESLSYLKDFASTLALLLLNKTRIHLYFGCDSLNALSGIVLKKIGFVDRVIFYSVDFVPMRFQNRFLNRFYHFTEMICMKNCDSVWNLSEEMITARRHAGILTDNNAFQQIVPIGVNSDRIKIRSMDKVDRFELVYMGHLREGQGLRLVMQTLPDIFQIWPKARFKVIGSGPLEKMLIAEARQMGLLDKVSFTGYVEDHEMIESMLCECGIGLALYEPSATSFSWYADPSKPKQYMACGLPVIITKVPPVARIIQEEKAGIVVDYGKSDLVKALHILLDDREKYFKYRENAIELASGYNWNRIFEKALDDLSERST